MTLVVGYDGSAGARAALAEALELGGRLSEGVHVVFSFESPRLGGELHDLDAEIQERGDAVVGEALRTAEAAGVTVSSDVRKQDPAEGLLAAADEVERVDDRRRLLRRAPAEVGPGRLDPDAPAAPQRAAGPGRPRVATRVGSRALCAQS